MSQNKNLQKLYESLQLRQRPEDVALMIQEVMSKQLNVTEKFRLRKAVRNALRNNVYGYTSMLQAFAAPIGAKSQIDKAVELFDLKALPAMFNYSDVEQVENFLKEVAPIIGMTAGKSDYMHDRLNRAERAAQGIELSRRRYNKLFRQLARVEAKLVKVLREQKKVEFQKIAKHGLAHHITWQDFSSDVRSACFIAYYTARANRRSEFTINGQSKPFDDICEMLYNKAARRGANYWAIAHVYPAPRVLAQLTDEQKGLLLGRWTSILHEIADLLREIWETNRLNKDRMIVRKGDDSTTWNNTAGAWNKARDAWMNLIYALGVTFILDEMCFGKVMRLIAGDVAYWHRSVGNKTDKNELVWRALPLPWEVFQDEVSCNIQTVREACHKADISPERSGWIAPRKHNVEMYKPTPELVHGVAVHSPYMAKMLKQHKYFSGKTAKPIYYDLN